MKQVMWHFVWILMTLWVICQKIEAGAFSHVLLVAGLIILVISILKHDKIEFIKTFRDENLTYDE